MLFDLDLEELKFLQLLLEGRIGLGATEQDVAQSEDHHRADATPDEEGAIVLAGLFLCVAVDVLDPGGTTSEALAGSGVAQVAVPLLRLHRRHVAVVLLPEEGVHEEGHVEGGGAVFAVVEHPLQLGAEGFRRGERLATQHQSAQEGPDLAGQGSLLLGGLEGRPVQGTLEIPAQGNALESEQFVKHGAQGEEVLLERVILGPLQVGRQLLPGHGRLGQHALDQGGEGGVHDLGGALEAHPHAVGAQDAVADALGLHLDDALGHALDDRQRVVHAEGDLFLARLLDELGEAAAGHVVPGHMGALAALQPIADAEDAGAAQQGHHPSGLRQPRAHPRLEQFLGEGPHQHMPVEAAPRDHDAAMDAPERIRGQFRGQQVGPEASVGAHD